MPEHDANLIVFRGGIQQVSQCDVHGRRHCVFPRRPIQLDPQDVSGTLGKNVTHKLTSYAATAAGFDATAAVAAGFAMTPLARRRSISLASSPSSWRTSSLCSPRSGARLAGTFATPCT